MVEPREYPCFLHTIFLIFLTEINLKIIVKLVYLLIDWLFLGEEERDGGRGRQGLQPQCRGRQAAGEKDRGGLHSFIN